MTDRPIVTDASYAELLAERGIGAVFQPLVDLRTGEVTAFEAFARGPAGTALERPRDLFAHAAATGTTTELDWVCRAAAFETFLAADLPPSTSLFVNVEAATTVESCPEDLLAVTGHAEASLRVFVEINDRAFLADPAGLLQTAERARRVGWGVSIDDAGSSPACLSVLPLVRADVVKLDVRTIRSVDDDDDGATAVATVLRHVEATGAALVVKGIESEDDVRLARAFGAGYGQGHHLGGPGPLPADPGPPRTVVPLVAREVPVRAVASPWDAVAHLAPRRTSVDDAAVVAGALARRALLASARPVVLLGPGHSAEAMDDRTRREWLAALAARSAVFVVMSADVPAEPFPGARGVVVPRGDVLTTQAFLVIMTEHLAMAIVSRPSTDRAGLDDVVATQDPAVVVELARHLMLRVPPVGDDRTALAVPVDGDDGHVVDAADGLAGVSEGEDPAPDPTRRRRRWWPGGR